MNFSEKYKTLSVSIRSLADSAMEADSKGSNITMSVASVS